jgi:hypothetical protein
MAALALFQHAVGSGRDGHQSLSGKAPPSIVDSDRITIASIVSEVLCRPAPAAEAMHGRQLDGFMRIGGLLVFSTTADEDRSSFCIELRGGLRRRPSKEG